MTDIHRQAGTAGATPSLADRYLELLKGTITRELFIEEEVMDCLPGVTVPWPLWRRADALGLRIVEPSSTADVRREGRDWPPHAETMIGRARLDNIQDLVVRAIDEETPGDLVEAGVWRGGAVVLMLAVLAAFDETTRRVWACDSFQGLPSPDLDLHPIDASISLVDDTMGDIAHVLAIPVEQVAANIARYGLLDERVAFVPGWFAESLPSAPIDQIAVLRIDCDLSSSTYDALTNLEHRVSPGGFVIVDDYGGIDACRRAVDRFRDERGITDEIQEIDWTGVWWQKSR